MPRENQVRGRTLVASNGKHWHRGCELMAQGLPQKAQGMNQSSLYRNNAAGGGIDMARRSTSLGRRSGD
jgi:hypothetical protein